jgi:lipopolysaccharide transport system ATP-binding protein
MNWSIRIENLSKQYRIGHSTVTAAELINERLRKTLSSLISRKMNNDALVNASSIETESRTVIDPSQLSNEQPNHFWALKEINLEIREGERLGIVGQNGCGKSTLLKILSRIITPTKGLFRFRGRLISLLEIGTGFHGELTGRENIFLNGTIMGMKTHEIKNRLNTIIEFSELGTMIDTPVKRYSSGMYIRLAFAVAAHLESEILIVDEVLAVGDAAFQRKCTEKMLDLSNQGRTLLFVSHDMDAVKRICNRAIRMSHGRIISDSSTNSLLKAQASVMDITRDYLRAGSKYTPEKKWLGNDCPVFSDCIQLHHVRILDDSNKVKSNFDLSENIVFDIDFTVIKEKLPINVHIYLKDSSGKVILVSMDNHTWSSLSIRPVGRYVEQCTVRAPMLNASDYSLDIEFWSGQDLNNRMIIRSIVSFEVTEDTSIYPSVRGNWSNEWPNALIRPKLEWKISTDKIANHNLQQHEELIEI